MSRAREQGGLTVVEVLVAMVVLAIVAVGAMTLMQVVMRQSRGVIEYTDAAQRGRLALDGMTRQIRSQVCLNEGVKGLIAATPTRLTFYADLGTGDAGQRPTRRVLQYVPASAGADHGAIVESVTTANAAGAYTNAPRNRTLIDNVELLGEPPAMFTYWAYPQPLPAVPQANQQLTGTLSAASVARVARVELAFGVRPSNGTSDEFMTELRDQVVLRNADPNAPSPDPTCI